MDLDIDCFSSCANQHCSLISSWCWTDELNSKHIAQQNNRNIIIHHFIHYTLHYTLYIIIHYFSLFIVSGRLILILKKYCGLLLNCLTIGSLPNRANKTSSLCFHYDFFFHLVPVSFSCFKHRVISPGCSPLQPYLTTTIDLWRRGVRRTLQLQPLWGWYSVSSSIAVQSLL